MLDTYVSLGTIESVKNFVTKITQFDEDFELIQGKYVVDAKSVLGIFSIDLSKPVLLRINAEGERLEQIKKAVKEFEA
ncbi:MAG: HPr family phosphocarrier protein [Clostridiaceae bacterium]|nr:HPr family phosphocarrier protein [Clostridiaceae bacterium]